MTEPNKKVIFRGSDLSINGGKIVYNKNKKDFKQSLNSTVGGKTYSSLKDAIKDVEKVLRG